MLVIFCKSTDMYLPASGMPYSI